jgi:transcriptional regulator with XRE-family HTH domain
MNMAEKAEEWGSLLFSEKLGILRRVRKDAGLTLKDVAEKAGVSIAYLSQLERGLYPTVKIETLGKIADACGHCLRVEIIDAKQNKFYWVY